MKLKTKYKKIIAMSLLVVIICSAFIGNFNNVYGAINKEYNESENISGTIDLDQATKEATVLEAVGHLVYALAGWAEQTIGKIIGSFTGSDIFPWADKVIFNTIPFLDVNFINPSDGSMFRNTDGTDTIFGDIIKKIYNTIFVLAGTFFSVVVGIMALKLAISSIASEKAKYKQAITNWLLALILLFTAHYLISFIFFVNEKMVEVARSILETQIVENEDTLSFDIKIENDPNKLNKVFENLIKGYYIGYNAGGNEAMEDVYCCWNEGFKGIKLVTFSGDRGKTFKYKFFTELGKVDSDTVTIKNDSNYNVNTLFQFKGTGYSWSDTNKAAISLNDNEAELVEEKFKIYLSTLLSNKDYMVNYRDNLSKLISSGSKESDIWFDFLNIAGAINSFKGADDKCLRDVRRVINDALYLVNKDKDVIEMIESSSSGSYYQNAERVHDSNMANGVEDMSEKYPEECKNVIASVSSKVNGGTIENAERNPINSIAEYFKENVYISGLNFNADVEAGDEVVDIQFQPIVAIMYSIFIIQSLMYFIAYMKRFFYIVILALFAPLVIIYDFLSKSISS